jgi:exodeoxyribonuclease-3
LRIATWNLNSLRARLPAVERFLDRTRPDVLCIQETRAVAVSADTSELLAGHGYGNVHVGAGSYNGVAILARHPLGAAIASSELGEEALDREPRLISCVVELPAPVRIVSVYVPHGRRVGHWHYEYKLAFMAALAARIRQWSQEGRLVVAGDVNVAATDSDVFHPDAFVGATHVTRVERDALAKLLAAGLIDVDVACWGSRARRFTWWKHGLGYDRNLGMRLDVIAVDEVLADHLDTTWIDHVERGGDRPSDHAALLADFHPEDL